MYSEGTANRVQRPVAPREEEDASTAALAPAPAGLSARRAEHWLDLPAGAWQKRRLYALRARTDAFRSVGVGIGDVVVVEPGAREQPGQIVLVRGPNGLALRRLANHPRGTMSSVLELPLRDRDERDFHRVVGTVLAVLRPTGTGALRPARPSARRPHATVGARAPSRTTAMRAPNESGSEIEDLRRSLQRSRLRLDAACGHMDPHDFARASRLVAGLSALVDCLGHARSTGLRAALLAEAKATAQMVTADLARK